METVPAVIVETLEAPIENERRTTESKFRRLDKKFFVVNYDESNNLAQSVEYRLSAANLRKSFVERADNFHADMDLVEFKIPPVNPNAYARTGYDRGHLAPSGDFEWSEEANEATFTMSNMAPQLPRLNRSAWKALETQIRDWACVEEELRIVTGPLLNERLSQLPSGVSIPKAFFKVILDDTAPRKAIGFTMNQDDDSRVIYKKRVKSVREIEKLTGLNFFADLDEPDRDRIEMNSDLTQWRGEKCKGISKSTVQEAPKESSPTGSMLGGISKARAKESKGKFACVKKTCPNISTCEEAMYLLNACGFRRLDGDSDGVPCEKLCGK